MGDRSDVFSDMAEVVSKILGDSLARSSESVDMLRGFVVEEVVSNDFDLHTER